MSAKIGADYAASAIYLGCLDGNAVKATGIIDVTNIHEGFELLKALLGAYHREYKTSNEIWLEHPWVNGSRFPLSGIKLARTATVLELAALSLGLEPMFVYPLVWRKAVYGKARVEDRKEAARNFVREHFGYDTKFKYQHNTAESILLAHYGNLQTL